MENLTIVHANELVDASYSLTLNEVRLICLAATKVDSRKANCGEIKIYISDFKKSYDVDYTDLYPKLRNAVKSLMRKPISINRPEDNKTIELSWLIKNEHDTSGDGSCVSMVFSPLIEPYLFELQKRFTSLDFRYASKLNTSIAFRMYQWLNKAKKLHSHKKGEAIEVVMEIDWIKKKTQLTTKYKEWRDFRRYVIEPSIENINTSTDISVEWDVIKKGRAVHAIKFIYIDQKQVKTKPKRPRLNRRPKVAKGSHEEGMWMRKNLKILLDYEAELKAYDPLLELTTPDLKRVAEYSSICDTVTHKRALKSLKLRKEKINTRAPRKQAEPEKAKETTYEDLGYDFDNE